MSNNAVVRNRSMKEQLSEGFGRSKSATSTPKPMNRNNKSPSVLSCCYTLPTDGDLINVDFSSKGIGAELSPVYKKRFATPLGEYINMSVFMMVVNTKNYPTYLESGSVVNVRRALTGTDAVKLHVPNYWAVVFEGLWCRISQDPKLMEDLKASKGRFTSYHVQDATKAVKSLVTNSSSSRRIYHYNLNRYIGILEIIRSVLQETDDKEERKEAIKDWIIASLDDPTVDIYENVAFTMT